MTDRRILYLDGIRGWSCLMVLVYHAWCGLFNQKWYDMTPLVRFLALFADGHFAVLLFFTTSGFSLASIEAPHKVVLTALARFPRLSLPIFAAALCAWVVDPRRSAKGFFVNLYALPISSVLPDGRLLVPHVGSVGTFMFGQLWTMEIELIGSFCIFSWTLAQPYLKKERRWHLLAAATLCILISNPYVWFFVLGLVLRQVLLVSGTDYHSHGVSIALSAPLYYLTRWCAGEGNGGGGGGGRLSNLWFFLLHLNSSVRIALLYHSVAGNARVRGFFENRVSQILGKISYSLYLTHHIAFVGVHSILGEGSGHLVDSTSKRILPFGKNICMCCVAFLLAVPFSELEVRLQRVARRVGQWFVIEPTPESTV
jgi:peptidoglycan/LPS O-acetylase OafA/YrhL